MEPTILNSISSSNSSSCTRTVHPTLIFSQIYFFFYNNLNIFEDFSSSSIRLQYLFVHLLLHRILRSLTSRPALFASLIFSATSFRFTTLKFSSSSVRKLSSPHKSILFSFLPSVYLPYINELVRSRICCQNGMEYSTSVISILYITHPSMSRFLRDSLHFPHYFPGVSRPYRRSFKVPPVPHNFRHD